MKTDAYVGIILIAIIIIFGIFVIVLIPNKITNDSIQPSVVIIKGNLNENYKSLNKVSPKDERINYTCYSEDIECFKYQNIDQEKGLGINKIPDQKKAEPCIQNKVICPLCTKPLDQEKGQGKVDILYQEKVNC